MNCKKCDKSFGKSECVSCGDAFISCNCTTNICSNCSLLIYSNPAKHRFGIAWFGLLDCLDHMDDQLSSQEKMAKNKLKKELLALIQECYEGE